MSNSKTDQLYKQLKNFGATGGKIIGAGGGGCFLCYVPKIIDILKKKFKN